MGMLAAHTRADETNTSGSLVKARKQAGVSLKRKRLHLLYLLNDVFHHTKYHNGGNTAAFSTFTSALQPHMVQLLGHAAAFDKKAHTKHHRRLQELLSLWAENGYYSRDYIVILRSAVENAAESGEVVASSTASGSLATGAGGNASTASTSQGTKDVPYTMPATHGDPSTPFYDLPAGNMLPHIVPNSTLPIRPDVIKPLQFLAGPADASLAAAVKKFLKEADAMFENQPDEESESEEEQENGLVLDVDALGQILRRDQDTGDLIAGEGYYGWSVAFCEKMKKRRKGDGGNGDDDNERRGRRGRSYSDSSRDGSRSPRKRRRYSDSMSEDSRSRSRSRGHERSHSQRQSSGGRGGLGRARSYSRSRSRSPSRPRQQGYPPPSFAPPHHQQQPPSYPPPPPNFVPPPPPPPQPQASQPPFPPLPHSFPAPPPRPPNWAGPWPPPPPPPLMPGMPLPFDINKLPPGMIPPPPPPPSQGHQGYSGQSGNSGYGYNGDASRDPRRR